VFLDHGRQRTAAQNAAAIPRVLHDRRYRVALSLSFSIAGNPLWLDDEDSSISTSSLISGVMVASVTWIGPDGAVYGAFLSARYLRRCVFADFDFDLLLAILALLGVNDSIMVLPLTQSRQSGWLGA